METNLWKMIEDIGVEEGFMRLSERSEWQIRQDVSRFVRTELKETFSNDFGLDPDDSDALSPCEIPEDYPRLDELKAAVRAAIRRYQQADFTIVELPGRSTVS